MAALSATLHSPLYSAVPTSKRNEAHSIEQRFIKTFRQGLRGRGKPAKVALTAVMRKLLIHLNSLLKTPLQTTA